MLDAATTIIRPVEDPDGATVAVLIAACFAEHEGCIYEPSEFPELAAPASWYRPKGTRMWVAEQDGRLVGCICATPQGDRAIELHKFYVAQHLRGAGLALRLTDLVFGLARELGATSAFLWTDTRFVRAHRFYEKQGFRKTDATRRLEDVSDTTEFHYAAKLDANGRPAP